MKRSGMRLEGKELVLDHEWVYFEAVKPTKNSNVHSYIRHRCYPQKLAGVSVNFGVFICNNCEEEATKEIVDKATVLMKMRIL